MKSLLHFLNFLIKLIPTTNILCFVSYPDYSDNSYAIFKYIVEHGYTKRYKLVWLVTEKSKISIIKKDLEVHTYNAKVVSRKSLLGLWYAIRCRHFFTTHGLYEAIDLHQKGDKGINLWHGMPFKRIGYMVGVDVFNTNTSYTIASSSFFKRIMAESFRINEDRVLLTGQPRCDLFWEETTFFTDKGIDNNKYKSIGVWMPTYRNSIEGDIRVDGIYKEGKITFLGLDELISLDKQLAALNTFLIIKLHPMDILQVYDFNYVFSNILIIKQKDFDYQLYPILGKCDFLLTDYSSVWIDYEILNKPIGFVMDDIKDYANSRGFTIDNPLDVLPGPILSDFDKLINFIENPVLHEKKDESLFNKYRDNSSSERIIKAINL